VRLDLATVLSDVQVEHTLSRYLGLLRRPAACSQMMATPLGGCRVIGYGCRVIGIACQP
jgi:hypothetical protein